LALIRSAIGQLFANVANKLTFGSFGQRWLAALFVIATIALVAQQHRLAGHQAHTAPLALVALPFDAFVAQIFDQLGRVLETIRMSA